MVEEWLGGTGVISPDSPDSRAESSADCAWRPIRISNPGPENLKPLLAVPGGCSLPALGVI